MFRNILPIRVRGILSPLSKAANKIRSTDMRPTARVQHFNQSPQPTRSRTRDNEHPWYSAGQRDVKGLAAVLDEAGFIHDDNGGMLAADLIWVLAG
jgi:hypothetical protein